MSAGIIQGVTGGPAEIQTGEDCFIDFRVSQPAVVTLTVIDSDFEPVKTFDMGPLGPGAHRVQWDGTDNSGVPVPPEAYAWTIHARTEQHAEIWEPAWLYSRPIEYIAGHQWNRSPRAVSFRLPATMRIWLRIGFQGGACMRLLVDGEPRPAGLIAETWDGLDETGQIDLANREDMATSIFGYRLPQPCVIVRGRAEPHALPIDTNVLARIAPPVLLSDQPWQRRRGFLLADRSRRQVHIERIDRDSFTALVSVPGAARNVQEQLLNWARMEGMQLRWFLDGRCVGQEDRTVLPAVITLQAGQIPQDGNRHFITANLTTPMHQLLVGSAWTDSGE